MASSILQSLVFMTSLILMGQCGTSNIAWHEDDLIIIEAKYWNWSPGTQQNQQPNQGGIIYSIQLTSTSDKPLRIDSLIVGEHTHPVEMVKGIERNFKGQISKGDTLLVMARSNYADRKANISNDLSVMLKQKGFEAALYYHANDNIRLMGIRDFDKVDPKSMNQ